MEAGELAPRQFADYKVITDLCISKFGTKRFVDDLAAADFSDLRVSMSKKWGPVRLSNSITRTKSMFKFGYESGLMERPVRYGPAFVKPSKTVMRTHRSKSAPKMFDADKIRTMIGGAVVVGESGPERIQADATLRAMILLGVNCGFGNTDCAELTFSSLDLEGGWIDFPRPKTGIARRCALWPETVAAIRATRAMRPTRANLRTPSECSSQRAGPRLWCKLRKGSRRT